MANFKLDSGTPLVIHLSGPGRYEISIRLSPPDTPVSPPPSDYDLPDLTTSGLAPSAPGTLESDTADLATLGRDISGLVASEPALFQPVLTSTALRESTLSGADVSSLGPKPKDKTAKGKAITTMAQDTKNKVTKAKTKAKTKNGKPSEHEDDSLEEFLRLSEDFPWV